MRILLDTHPMWWWLADDPRLSDVAREILVNGRNQLVWSLASSWEIAIKATLKKLELPAPPSRYIPSRLDAMGLTPLPVEHGHALRVAQLPSHHGDPFDRLLVAQSQLEDWASAAEPPAAVHERPRRRWGRRKTTAAR